MRISQRQMFTAFTGQMNGTLASLMDSNNQGGTGKKINRPSDDPANMARVLMYRESLSNIERNKANINEATGWLNLADHALMQVSDIISKIKTLNLQSSTETQSSSNREQNAIQLRGYFGELLNIANEKYNGQHIFAGHKVDAPAYAEGVAVTCNYSYQTNPADPDSEVNLTDQVDFVAHDGAAQSTLIQFTSDGTLGIPGAEPGFIYSKDGGASWETGTWLTPLKAGTNGTMIAGGVEIDIHLKDPAVYPAVTAVPPGNPGGVDAKDLASQKESLGGTWLTVRPTAVYLGDDHDTQVAQSYGPAAGTATADGYFTRDVSVRIKHPATLPSTDPIEYEYSLDNGSNWIKATAAAGSAQLAVPGGNVKITGNFQAGQEFLVHPRRADIDFEISSNQTITVNNVGKDIFGGMYTEPFSAYAQTIKDPNLFDTVGELIGYCETNDSDGIARALEKLDDCLKLITTKLADVGGRENRLQVAFETATIRELSEDNARSAIEDVDTVTLMTKLAQQQLAYNTVLKSSSMIMQMSLMNFI